MVDLFILKIKSNEYKFYKQEFALIKRQHPGMDKTPLLFFFFEPVTIFGLKSRLQYAIS